MTAWACFWLLLAPSYFITRTFFPVLASHTLDLRFEAVAQYAAIPLVQATALAWLASPLGLGVGIRVAKRALRRPWVAAVWCFEAALLVAWWIAPFGVDLTEAVARMSGFMALLAVVAILLSMRPSAEASAVRPTIIPFALLVAVLGSNSLKPWLGSLAAWLPAGWPFLLRQFLCVSVLLAAAILVTAWAQGVLAARSHAAAVILGGVHPLCIVAALSLIINGYLYAFMVGPWLHITTGSLSLAATCVLTSALCLRSPAEPASNFRVRSWEADLVALWLVLSLSSFAGTMLLQVALFRHWAWSTQTLLSLVLIPLVQGSWVRWAKEARENWKAAGKLALGHPALGVLCSLELAFFGYLAFYRDLGEGRAVTIGVSLWVGFKLILLGLALLKEGMRTGLGKRLEVVCGAGALICGVASVSIFAATSWWMIGGMGSVLALVGVGWSQSEARTVRFAGVSAEGLLALIPLLAAGVLLSRGRPMVWVVATAYLLLVMSTTLTAMGLREKAQIDSCTTTQSQ